MPYDKTSWENYITPLDEDNMNHIEDGIANANNKSDRNENDITQIKTDITVIESDIVALNTKADSKLPKQQVNVVNDVSISVNGDQVEMTKSSASLENDVITPSSETSTVIPAATSTQSGLMTSSTVNAIAEMQNDINQLKSKTTRLLYTESENPSSDQILTFVVNQGYTSPFSGIAVVVDKTFHIWHFYENIDSWQDDGLDTTSKFTNTYAGIIKGSENDGQVYAEDDGTGSVMGWDNVKQDIASNTEDISKRAFQRDLDTANDNISKLEERLTEDEVILNSTLRKDESAPIYDSVVMISTENEQILKNINTFVITENQDFDTDTQAIIRNNIGAGTSSFDGDYSSLTSKPVVNTTSSESLTPTSEELSSLINLHKISKTGTSTDLTDTEDLVRQNELSSLEEIVNSKLTEFNMIFDGSTITHNNEVLTIDDIYRALDDSTLYVKLMYNSDVYHAMSYTQESIVFTSTFVDNDSAYTKVITVTNSEITYQVISSAAEITLYNEKGQNTDGAMTQKSTTDELNSLSDRIDDLQLYKFPNATIVGEPTINNGQISDFSSTDYLQFPFVVDMRNKTFEINFVFTTGANVTTQQNVLDSYFGLALAIQNGVGVMALSSNGSSWNIGNVAGTIAIQPNTTYYAKMTWDGNVYKTSLSTDGISYIDDMSINSTASLYPRTIFIGGSYGLFGSGTDHPWLGSINMNYAELKISDIVVWTGMDDVGLATRANVNLSNISEEGKQVIRDTSGSSQYATYFVNGVGIAQGQSNLSTKWQGVVDGITEPYNGMKLFYRINTWGSASSAGAVLSLDGGTHYYPIVYNVNSTISSRYSAGAVIVMCFNSTQTARAYLTAGVATTVTGCWQIMDYGNYPYMRMYNLATTDADRDLVMRYDTSSIASGANLDKFGAITSNVILKANPKTGQLKAVKFTENGVDLATKYALKTEIPTDYITAEDAGTTQEGVTFYTKTESDEKYVQQGGALTQPLTVTGGDGSTAGKIQFDVNGQITKRDSTSTLFGLDGNNLLIGHNSLDTKIRGNSISFSLNSLENPSISDFNYATRNNSKITDGECIWIKIGKLVLVTLSDIATNGITQTDDDVLFSGLPNASEQVKFILVASTSSTQTIRCRITSDGKIVNHYNYITPSAAVTFCCSFWYIAQ